MDIPSTGLGYDWAMGLPVAYDSDSSSSSSSSSLSSSSLSSSSSDDSPMPEEGICRVDPLLLLYAGARYDQTAPPVPNLNLTLSLLLEAAEAEKDEPSGQLAGSSAFAAAQPGVAPPPGPSPYSATVAVQPGVAPLPGPSPYSAVAAAFASAQPGVAPLPGPSPYSAAASAPLPERGTPKEAFEMASDEKWIPGSPECIRVMHHIYADMPKELPIVLKPGKQRSIKETHKLSCPSLALLVQRYFHGNTFFANLLRPYEKEKVYAMSVSSPWVKVKSFHEASSTSSRRVGQLRVVGIDRKAKKLLIPADNAQSDTPFEKVRVEEWLRVRAGIYFNLSEVNRFVRRQNVLSLLFFADIAGVLDQVTEKVDHDKRKQMLKQREMDENTFWPEDVEGLTSADILEFRGKVDALRRKYLGKYVQEFRAQGIGPDELI